MNRLLAFALCLLFAETLPSQSWAWHDHMAAGAPRVDLRESMVYRTSTGTVFARDDGRNWSWNGAAWTQLNPLPNPSNRENYGFAYDANRDRVVMFGGSFGPHFDETWEWDGTNWTLLNPVTKPPDLEGSVMVYDSLRQRCVLTGGVDGLSSFFERDVWEWDGTNWTEIQVALRPPGRSHTAAAYDAPRDRVVLFGGQSQSGVRLDDTWEWDRSTNTWTQLFPATKPSARHFHQMSFAPDLGIVVLQAGVDGVVQHADSWSWDGANWTLIANTLPPGGIGQAPRSTYNSATKRLVVAGFINGTTGIADFYPVVPADYVTLGAGCLGTAGVPTMTPVAGSRMWIGETHTVAFTNIPVPISLIAFVGCAESIPPVDLAPVGAPGCFLFTNVVVQVPLTTASWSLAIPYAPTAVGAELFQQALVIDPGANPAGVTVTDAGRNTIGQR